MRYLPHTKDSRKKILEYIGKKDINDLFSHLPEILEKEIDLPKSKSEIEVENILKRIASKNLSADNAISFAGCGAYNHHVPATVDYLIQRSEFLTSYTPYQPEIAQGTLQYLFEFQSQICRMTNMDIANASLYDGSTATIEAILMAIRIKRKNKIISFSLHPHYFDVCQNYLSMLDDSSIQNCNFHEYNDDMLTDDLAAIVIQTPDFFGNINDFNKIIKLAREKNIMVIYVTTEIVSLGLLKLPMGVDIFVAEGQSIGNNLNFGGPYVGIFATRKEFQRQIPGRICGHTSDIDGKDSYVLTLSTREQHIRREKATSNICTNSGLCALAFTIHMTLLGGVGLRRLAIINHNRARYAFGKISAIENISIKNKSFFNEFTITLPFAAEKFVNELCEENIIAGVPASRFDKKNENDLICAFSELTSKEDIDILCNKLREYKS